MGRGQQADPAAQIMRAIAPPGREGSARHRVAAGDAAPFRDIGLHDLHGTGRQQLGKGRLAPQVLAGCERQPGRLGQPPPGVGRLIDRQRLLQPDRPERRQGLGHGQRRLAAPGLVGIDRDRRRLADHGLDLPDIGQIQLAAEADLELEGAKARGLGQRRLGRRPVRIDAAGIAGHPARAVAAQEPPERLAGPARQHVPDRDVDPGDRLGERAGLAGLQAEQPGRAGQAGQHLGRPGPFPLQQQRRQHGLDQARPVLGAAAGKVAPDLAQADHAGLADHLDQHRRPVGHQAEGGAHRQIDRRPIDLDLDRAQQERLGRRQAAGSGRRIIGGRHGWQRGRARGHRSSHCIRGLARRLDLAAPSTQLHP